MRIILLVDMDAFYTSCEEVRHPGYKGKPLAVGADPKGGSGRGVVATANYEARKYGIRSAMPISIAYRTCTDCVFLPVDMEYYAETSNKVMRIIERYADSFEQVSIDEAFCDISSCGSFGKAEEIAKKIQEEILEKEGLTCSVGIGPNKLIAKMTASKNKPNKVAVTLPEDTQKFLDPLDVDDLVGVGPKTTEVLKKLGIDTIGQLAKIPLDALHEYFGQSFARYLHDASHGKDESPVLQETVQKSVARNTTFEHDTDDKELIHATLDRMIDDAFMQIREQGLKSYRTITLTVRYTDFETHTKAYTLIAAATQPDEAKSVAKNLLEGFMRDSRRIRLVGISLGKLK